ncbi:MAG TPA: hypothetical protein DIW23_12085, partial [Anaerolineae bacterium]|nr:hypothetical protein [Anaerolineae bacterium]
TRFIEIQRVQYITNEDAWAEGCPRDIKGFPRDWYYELWDTLNGDKYPVASNPWVWVYKFPSYLQWKESNVLQEKTS